MTSVQLLNPKFKIDVTLGSKVNVTVQSRGIPGADGVDGEDGASGGASSLAVRVMTMAASIYAADQYVIYNGPAGQTLPLPVVSGLQQILNFKNSSSGSVTLVAAGSEVLDEGAAITIPSQNSVQLIGKNGVWYVS